MANSRNMVLTVALLAGVAMCDLEVTRLRCEFVVEPVGIGESRPVLDWRLAPTSPKVGLRQSAYQIQAVSSKEVLAQGIADLWDSGKVASDKTANIVWHGRSLGSNQPVFWRVRVWDGADRPSRFSSVASFSTGLLKNGDWTAHWIGDGNARRTSEPGINGYHSEVRDTPDALERIVLDLGATKPVEGVALYPARPFNWPGNVDGFLFPLRYRVLGSNRQDMSDTLVFEDRTETDQPSPGDKAVRLSWTAKPVRYLVLETTRLRNRGDDQYGMALAEMAVLSGGKNAAKGLKAVASSSTEMAGWGLAHLTDGINTSSGPNPGQSRPAARFRKAFIVQKPIRRAAAFATALGVYSFWINGKPLGNRHLAPDWTDYRTRVQSQTYDVTDHLQQGRNVVAMEVADGWYAGHIGMHGREVYGFRPLVRAQIVLEHTDGSRSVLGTDETWQVSSDGPIRSADLLDGESHDLRMEQEGWLNKRASLAGWTKPVIERPRLEVTPQTCPPIRVFAKVKPVAVTEPQKGVFVVDFGQNVAGTARFRLGGPSGTTVTFRFAEALENGLAYTANLRGAAQIDRCTLSGKARWFEPRYTYHGFRYVQIEGLPTKPAVDDAEALPFSTDVPRVGDFKCSDPMLNQLWRNIVWTLRANLMSVPTDCPQRDERLGWMGDIQAFGPTAEHVVDMAPFWNKWTWDQRDAQTQAGAFPDFIPTPRSDPNFSGTPAWADAGVFCPWVAYRNHADRRLLERHFEAARRWVDHVERQNPTGRWLVGRGADYNDWLNGDTLQAEGYPKTGGAIPNEVLATAFWAQSTAYVRAMAEELGRPAEAAKYRALRAKIESAFVDAYLGPDGTIKGGTQAGYALALNFGLVPETRRPQVLERLKESLARVDGRLSTGIQTTHRLLIELSQNGMHDEACRLVQSKGFPSWGYMIENGATTIWERWDGYVKGRGFQSPGMNSLNHWALGSVGEWLVRCLAGLEQHPGSAGWRKAVLRPMPGGTITSAEATYDSLSGRYRLAWKLVDGRLEIVAEVPPNCTAELQWPSGFGLPSQTLLSGKHRLSRAIR